MISLTALAELARDHADDLDRPVEPLRLGDRVVEVSARPALMGTVNLSRDSTYRESIAVSVDAAIGMGRVMAAQGAELIDIGAESSTARAARVTIDEQIDRLIPVVEGLVESRIAVSAETYEPEVARAALAAGATVLNFTGREHELEMYDLAAEFGATVIICAVRGANVREISDVELDTDPFPALERQFVERVELARRHGVDRIIIDPGMGFFYGNLVDPSVRARHQAQVLLSTFRLRRLGLPICHALPHAFDLFGDEFRTAEGFFAVLAMLGGTSLLRTHEVPRVRRVVDAMAFLDVR